MDSGTYRMARTSQRHAVNRLRWRRSLLVEKWHCRMCQQSHLSLTLRRERRTGSAAARDVISACALSGRPPPTELVRASTRGSSAVDTTEEETVKYR